MRESSVSDRSATPVPASTRMSLSSSIEVVRRCRPPIPPLQPRIRSFIAALPSSFFVEYSNAVPVRRQRITTVQRHLFGIKVVKRATGVHPLQIEQADL